MNSISLTHYGISNACLRAQGLEEAGDYEQALCELRDFWDGPGNNPRIAGLDERDAAELLLRTGVLSERLGSAKQIPGCQELARDLLSRASEKFVSLRDDDKVAEARAGLAICYWRNGSFDEARMVLRGALEANSSADAKLRVMNNLAMVEWHAGNLSEALNLYSESRVLCESSANCFVLGNYHMNYSIALRAAGRPSEALVEAATASLQLEQAGHLRHQARVLNNVGMILLDLERLDEAHQNLDQAERLFLKVDDHGGTAQVAETRARVYLAAREYDKAEEFARSAVDMLSVGDEKANLVEAMVTHATTLARLKQTVASIERFGEACEIAGQFMNERAVTDITVKLVEELVGPAYLGANVKFEEAILRMEAKLIKEALQRSNGRVTEAAVRLGLKKHQNLCWMLRTRHSDLQSSRDPVQPRRRTQMNKENEGKVVRMRRVATAD